MQIYCPPTHPPTLQILFKIIFSTFFFTNLKIYNKLFKSIKFLGVLLFGLQGLSFLWEYYMLNDLLF
jgi:hypothetical protein